MHELDPSISSTLPSWDGATISPGPIAVSLERLSTAAAEGELVLVAASTSSATYVVPVDRFADFVDCHPAESFVCFDVAELYWWLKDKFLRRGDERCSQALRNITRTSRWLDIRLLDRLVRYGDESADPPLSKYADLVRRWSNDSMMPIGQRTSVSEDPCQLNTMLKVAAALDVESTRIATDVSRPAGPVPKDTSLGQETRDQMQAEIRRVMAASRRTTPRDNTTADRPVELNDRTCTEDTGSQRDEKSTARLGLGIEMRGAIALAGIARAGALHVDRGQLDKLLLETGSAFDRACGLLAGSPEARASFNWDGDKVRRRPNGMLDIKRAELRAWLCAAAEQLCDMQNQPAAIPTDGNREPSLDPERWGIWAACDRAIWSWRELHRVAEIESLAKSDDLAQSKYQPFPRLRSKRPNLAAYRRYRMPIFRPRSGWRFVAGRVEMLHAYCMAAICLRQGYVAEPSIRLHNYFLAELEPLDAIARELFIASAVQDSGVQDSGVQDSGVHSETARKEFEQQKFSNPDVSCRWRRLAQALLETVPLGLDGRLLAEVLRNDYGFDDLHEPEVLRLQGLLIDDVIYEAREFLKDDQDTIDRLAARSQLTFESAGHRYIRPKHPETSAAAMRNRLLSDQRRQWLGYRALSLGGRPTTRALQAQVRQQQVLATADETMLQLAYDLQAADFTIVAVTGHEFVVETVAVVDHEVSDAVRKLATRSTTRFLGVRVPIDCQIVDRW